MADKRWVSTDGNLATAASYSPAIVPVAGESLFFDGTSQMDAVAGLSTFSTFDLTTVWLQRPYEGDVGANGNPFTCQVRRLIHQGTGSLFHAYETHTTANNVVIDSPNVQDAYTLASVSDNSGTFTFLQGTSQVLNDVGAIGAILVNQRPGGMPVKLVVGTGTGAVTTYRQFGGYVSTKRDFGTSDRYAWVAGGTLVYEATGTEDWANVVVGSGGRFIYNGTGTMTICTVHAGGVLDMSLDSRAKTITGLTLFPGATYIDHSNITVTTKADLRGSVPILP